jgi:hypothetical protein
MAAMFQVAICNLRPALPIILVLVEEGSVFAVALFPVCVFVPVMPPGVVWDGGAFFTTLLPKVPPKKLRAPPDREEIKKKRVRKLDKNSENGSGSLAQTSAHANMTIEKLNDELNH